MSWPASTLETLPPGRVYAGLPANWGDTMRFADVKFYNLLPFEALEGLPPPSESFSLNADLIWDFHENDHIDYELCNARYVIAPAELVLPDLSDDEPLLRLMGLNNG